MERENQYPIENTPSNRKSRGLFFSLIFWFCFIRMFRLVSIRMLGPISIPAGFLPGFCFGLVTPDLVPYSIGLCVIFDMVLRHPETFVVWY